VLGMHTLPRRMLTNWLPEFTTRRPMPALETLTPTDALRLPNVPNVMRNFDGQNWMRQPRRKRWRTAHRSAGSHATEHPRSLSGLSTANHS
jgi:hypothetical protein